MIRTPKSLLAIFLVILVTACGGDPARAPAHDSTGAPLESADGGVDPAVDVIPPTVAVVSPIGGPITGETLVQVDAKDDVGFGRVRILVDGEVAGEAIQDVELFGLPFNTATVADGAHTIVAEATDAAGNVTMSSPVAITTANPTAVPWVSITAPGNGGTYRFLTMASASVAAPGGIGRVSFLVDGAEHASLEAGPFVVSLPTLAPGAHRLQVRAVDRAGRSTLSAPITFHISEAGDDARVVADGACGGPTTGWWALAGLLLVVARTRRQALRAVAVGRQRPPSPRRG